MRMKEIVFKVEEIKEDLCDNYCKYPGTEPDLHDKCETCPLNRLDNLVEEIICKGK